MYMDKGSSIFHQWLRNLDLRTAYLAPPDDDKSTPKTIRRDFEEGIPNNQ